jgi:hypothetical protein
MIDHGNALEFPETGKWVLEPFRSHWLLAGGLPDFGLPISGMYKDETGKDVQYFERARFETVDGQTVQKGLLGVEHYNLLQTVKAFQAELAKLVRVNPSPLKPG